jgi:hypothetical protein
VTTMLSWIPEHQSPSRKAPYPKEK